MTRACFSFCLYALCQFATFKTGCEQLASPPPLSRSRMQMLFPSILMAKFEGAVRDGVYEVWKLKCNASLFYHSMLMLQKACHQVAGIYVMVFQSLSWRYLTEECPLYVLKLNRHSGK